MNNFPESVAKFLNQTAVAANNGLSKLFGLGSKIVDQIPVSIQDTVAKHSLPVYGILIGAIVTSAFIAPYLTTTLCAATLGFTMLSHTCIDKSTDRATQIAFSKLCETETAVSPVEKPTFKPNAVAPDFKNAVNTEQPADVTSNANDAKPIAIKPPSHK